MRELAIALPEIIPAYRVVGNEHYILQVVLPSMQHLESIMEKFLQLGSVDVSIILSTPVTNKGMKKLS
jgi:Lrp/AsnC family transcriptional regulator, leucine-responsive regulatory protein